MNTAIDTTTARHGWWRRNLGWLIGALLLVQFIGVPSAFVFGAIAAKVGAKPAILGSLVLYISFTILVTNWRTQFRKQMNELDSTAHTKAIDSLLNYETVKYFNNEDYEATRYNESLERLPRAALKSQTNL